MEESLFSLLKAYKFQIKGKFNEAIQIYNSHDEKFNDSEVKLYRAIAYSSIGNFNMAAEDLNSIINKVESTNILSLEARVRLSEVEFRLGNFEKAKDLAEKTIPLLKETDHISSLQRTISKCKCELSGNKIIKNAPVQSAQKKVETSEKKPESNEPEIKKTNILSSSGEISYVWHQNDFKVFIEFPVSISSPNDFVHKIEENSASFSIKLSEESQKDFNFNFFSAINSKKATINFSLSKIEVVMEKSEVNKFWPTLESTTTTSNPNPTSQFTKPSYPSSSKVKKDWSKIDKECDELLKDEEGDPAMKLFREIYSNSDEDTRRAMMKSMQESDGTVL